MPPTRPLARHCHVARRHFFVQDAWRSGDIVVPAVDSNRNRADLLTKVIDTPHYHTAFALLRRFIRVAP